MTREVRQQAVVGPGGRIVIVAPDLPAGAVAEVIVRLAEGPPPANGAGSRPPERPVAGFTEVVQWYHHDEWRGKVRGTGLEVWEIIDQYLALGRDFGVLLVGYPDLTVEQVRQALRYGYWYPDEIDALLRRQYEGAPREFAEPPVPAWP